MLDSFVTRKIILAGVKCQIGFVVYFVALPLSVVVVEPGGD
jgi:hypothetical protein